MCWQTMADTLNTSTSEVQRRAHNLRNQVSRISRTVLNV